MRLRANLPTAVDICDQQKTVTGFVAPMVSSQPMRRIVQLHAARLDPVVARSANLNGFLTSAEEPVLELDPGASNTPSGRQGAESLPSEPISDIMCLSGRRMIETMIKGKEKPSSVPAASK
jgi:hypothetical protein